MAEVGVLLQLVQMLTQCSAPPNQLVLPLVSYDKNPPVPELIEGQGYPVEIHPIVTADGYILSLHRIPYGVNDIDDPSSKRPVVFLHHGLMSSSADFLMNAPHKALAYMLADAGYDVWLANCRGNRYSRAHKTLSVNKAAYWSFSWDEIAEFDVPAAIQYILQVTQQEQLSYVGFSMGTTVFFAAMSERPHLMEKVKVMAAIAPVAYFQHVKGLARLLFPAAGLIDIFLHLTGVNFLASGRKAMDAFISSFCGSPYSRSMAGCIDLLSSLVGPEHHQMVQEILPLALIEFPAGASPHTVLHYSQLFSGSFRKFDYGTKCDNRQHYGQNTPPRYYPYKITVPIALFSGDNDYLAPPEDVERLKSELPNVIFHKEVSQPHFNHLDFLWGRDAPEIVYDSIIGILNQYN